MTLMKVDVKSHHEHEHQKKGQGKMLLLEIESFLPDGVVRVPGN